MIFLSYAKEDTAIVQLIYRELRYANLQPWMATPPSPWALEGIGPGDDWDAAIRSRLAEAELVLLFLSKASVTKHGYVQREYRLALDLAAACPPGRIFLIPVLLDDCLPPNLRVGPIALRQLQWYPYFNLGMSPLLDHIAREPLASRPPAAAPRPMVSLQKTLIDMFELDTLAPEKAAEMLDRLAKMVFQAVLVRGLPLLSEERMTEYERIIDSDEDLLRLFAFLRESIPGFDDIVLEEADLLRSELAGEFKEFGL